MPIYQRPAPPWLTEDTLEDLERGFAEQGVTGSLSLRADGTVLIETEATPAALQAALEALRPVPSPEQAQVETDRATLAAYLALPVPTNTQSVAAIKSLIRVVARLGQRSAGENWDGV